MASYEINYKSDFTVVMGFTLAGVAVPLPVGNFRIVFRTHEYGTEYECSRINGEYVNCKDNGNDTLLCIFDRHGLRPGALRGEVFDYIPDNTYPDGSQLVVTPSLFDLELVEGAGNTSEGVTAEVVISVEEVVEQAREAAQAAVNAAEEATDAAGRASDAADRAEEYIGSIDIDNYYTKSEINQKLADITYATISQSDVDGGTSTTAKLITPKLLVDNFAKRRTYVDNSADASVELSVATYNDLGTLSAWKPVTLPAAYNRGDEFVFRFVCGDADLSPVLPSGVVMADGFDFSEMAVGVLFQVSIMDGIAAYLVLTPNT